jgi:hypothetical protein
MNFLRLNAIMIVTDFTNDGNDVSHNKFIFNVMFTNLRFF